MRSRYLLDTNVLIPFYSKDFFLELATRGLSVHWSRSIEKEFRRVWGRLYPGRASDAEVVLRVMRAAAPGWRAGEPQEVLSRLSLPDPDDRHVAAAAYALGGAVIVTRNLRDFPPEALEPLGLRARTPDAVLCDLFDEQPELIVAAAAAMRGRLRRPPQTANEWLAGLRAGQLAQLAARLESRRADI